MKHYGAFVFLILMPCAAVAQTSLSTQNKLLHCGRILSIEFRGNHNFSSETLRDFMRTKVGEPYSAEKLEIDKYRLHDLLGRKGYLQAYFDEPEIASRFIGLEIVVPMQEGIPYRAGAITVKGSTVLPLEDVIKTAGVKSGEIVDGHAIKSGLETLNKLYHNRGYFQFDAMVSVKYVETARDAEEGVVDVTLELEEDEVYRINTIRFEGNTKTTDEVLRRQLRIHEDEMYNEDLLEKSLKHLNALGLYDELILVDVAFHADTKSNQLDITIRLKEKGN